MSAQLAIYLILSIPLYHCSRFFAFINTSPLQELAFELTSKGQGEPKRLFVILGTLLRTHSIFRFFETF
jgi:hypothetical protein